MWVGRMPARKNVAAGCQQGCRRSVLPRNSCVQHCSSARRGDKKCLSPVACRSEHAFSVVSSSLHPAGRKGKAVQKKSSGVFRGQEGEYWFFRKERLKYKPLCQSLLSQSFPTWTFGYKLWFPELERCLIITGSSEHCEQSWFLFFFQLCCNPEHTVTSRWHRVYSGCHFPLFLSRLNENETIISTCHFQHRSVQVPDAPFPDSLIIWHGAVCLESAARRAAPGRGQAELMGKGCSHTRF